MRILDDDRAALDHVAAREHEIIDRAVACWHDWLRRSDDEE